eukprot:566904-Pelagomonas_calceolata.AAC.1
MGLEGLSGLMISVGERGVCLFKLCKVVKLCMPAKFLKKKTKNKQGLHGGLMRSTRKQFSWTG